MNIRQRLARLESSIPVPSPAHTTGDPTDSVDWELLTRASLADDEYALGRARPTASSGNSFNRFSQ